MKNQVQYNLQCVSAKTALKEAYDIDYELDNI